MNKKLLALAALISAFSLSAAAFAACGDGENGSNTGNPSTGDDNPSTPSVYTVTFDTNGASEIEAQQVTPGQSINLGSYTVTVPDDNYFYGWYLDEEFTMRAPSTFTPTSSVTLYAYWGTTRTYTLTFDSCGGSEVAPREYYAYSFLAEPQVPTRAGYTFAGWYWDEDYSKEFIFVGNTMPATDLTIYARWTEQTVTLTFDSNGGSAVASIETEAGDTVSAPAAPEREGYIFDGWYADEDLTTPYIFGTLTADTTIYAKWREHVSVSLTGHYNFGDMTAVFGLSGNEGTHIPDASHPSWQAMVDRVNNTFGMPVYIFGGWFFDEECTQPCTVYPVGGDGTDVYALWLRSAAYCAVTFVNDTTSLTVYVQKTGTISDTSGIESVFGSSFVDMYGNAYDLTSSFESDVTLYAAQSSDLTFEANASYGYTVTGYAGDGGDIVIPSTYNGEPVTAIAFENVSAQSVTIPDSVTKISANAFSSVTSVNGGDYLTEIGENAFGSYAGVEANGLVYLNDNRTVLLSYSGSASAVTIPASVKVMADGAFAGNANVTSVRFASGGVLIAIPDGAFENCTNLVSVNLSALRLREVGEGAFSGTSLSEIVLPETTSAVGASAFENCTHLTSISAAGLRELGFAAFKGCTSLVSVDFTGVNLSFIPSEAFAGCTSLEAIVLPEVTRSIGGGAFSGCTSLTTVTVNAPDECLLTEIGGGAFNGCSSLNTIILFSGSVNGELVQIGDGAFEGCASDLVVFVSAESPDYDRSSPWYDAESDSMLSYVEIYSAVYEGVTFAEGDLTVPVIKAENFSIVFSLSQVGENTDLVSLLVANGVSATDNSTAAEDIVFSVSRVGTALPVDGEEDTTALTANADGTYNLTETGNYYVSVRATDRFGNYASLTVVVSVIS